MSLGIYLLCMSVVVVVNTLKTPVCLSHKEKAEAGLESEVVFSNGGVKSAIIPVMIPESRLHIRVMAAQPPLHGLGPVYDETGLTGREMARTEQVGCEGTPGLLERR